MTFGQNGSFKKTWKSLLFLFFANRVMLEIPPEKFEFVYFFERALLRCLTILRLQTTLYNTFFLLVDLILRFYLFRIK